MFKFIVYSLTYPMAQFFEIHSQNPQRRLISQTIEIIRNGGVIAYPTDSSYAIACRLDDKQASDKIRRIRQLDEKHDFTLICQDLAQIATFSKIGNEAFRLIKSLTPGPYTFILDATKEVPRRLQHAKKKTIGIRIPDHAIAQVLVAELGEPLLSATLIFPGETESIADPYDIRSRLEHEIDLVIDAGIIHYEPTTIIGFENNSPILLRQGKGPAPMLEN